MSFQVGSTKWNFREASRCIEWAVTDACIRSGFKFLLFFFFVLLLFFLLAWFSWIPHRKFDNGEWVRARRQRAYFDCIHLALLYFDYTNRN